MSTAVMKIYKTGCLCIACNRNFFVSDEEKRQKEYFNFAYSVSDYYEAVARARNIILSAPVEYTDKYLALVRAKENKKMRDLIIKNDLIHLPLVDREKRVKHIDIENTSAESVRKARRRAFDVVHCNEWDFYCTLTFSSEYVDRHSKKDVVSALTRFCKNYFRVNSGAYIFVPQLHEDGAFHFHGFISVSDMGKNIIRAHNPYNGKELFSDFGRPLYNLSSWNYGFSSLEPVSVPDDISLSFEERKKWVDGNRRMVSYALRYITRDGRCLPRFYYSGGYLIRKPAVVHLSDSLSAFEQLLDAGALKYECSSDVNLQFASLWLDDPLDSLEVKNGLF